MPIFAYLFLLTTTFSLNLITYTRLHKSYMLLEIYLMLYFYFKVLVFFEEDNQAICL